MVRAERRTRRVRRITVAGADLTTFTPAGPDQFVFVLLPPPGRRDLLVADETGLPATGAILDWLPPGSRAEVVVEVADASERQPLATGPGVRVRWLQRDGAPTGTTSSLVDAVRALELPAGRPYMWGGGESRAMTRLRRHLRAEVGLARDSVSLTAYWRHADHRPDDEGDPVDGAGGAGAG